MVPDLQTVTQMNDLTNAIHALIGAIVLGITGVAGAYLYQVKVYLPNVFKRRDEERATQIEAAKQELKNKSDAEQVDIARENMLPKLMDSQQRMAESAIQMGQSFNATMMQHMQTMSTWNAQLTAHDKQLSTNTDRLEELAMMVETSIANIQNLKAAVETNTGHSMAAAAYGDRAAKAAEDTLALVKREIDKVVAKSKHDTGELPSLEHVTEPPKADDSAALPKAG